jgi:hypothetical protein
LRVIQQRSVKRTLKKKMTWTPTESAFGMHEGFTKRKMSYHKTEDFVWVDFSGQPENLAQLVYERLPFAISL